MPDIASLIVKVDSRDIQRGKQDLDSFSKAGAQAERSAVSMASAVRSAAAAFGAFAGAREFVRIADQMTNLESRIKLTLTATQSYVEVQKELLAVANSSRVALADVGTLYARIAPSVQKLGGGQREAIGITNALSKALLISGASTQEASSAIIQFSQAMASGVLRGEEFNAISEAAPIILTKLEQSLGVTRGELRKMAEQGLLTSAVVGNVLTGAVGDLERQAAKMAPTVAGSFVVLKNSLSLVVEEINKAAGVTPMLAKALEGVTQAVDGFTKAIQGGALTQAEKQALGVAAAVASATAAVTALTVAIGAARAAAALFNTVVGKNPLVKLAMLAAGAGSALLGYKAATEAVETAQDNAAKSTEAAAAPYARLKAGVVGLTDAQKKAAKEAQKLADDQKAALQSIADQVAKLNMTEGEQRRFDFLKLKPSAEQLAAFDQYNAKLEDAARKAAELEGWGYVIDQIFKKQEESAREAAKAIDDYLGKDYGANLAAGFDKASQSLGQFVNGFTRLISAQEDYNKARVAAKGDVATLAKLEAKNARDQINAYANITGAAKGFFKEGSKGYKALEAAETAFRAVQLALALKDVAVKLGLMQTETAAVVATEGVKQGTYAVTAQAAALTIPPPASFAALAAVVAVLASLGLSGKGAKGPGFTDNNGTGTVLGDPSAQSESLANSIGVLEEAATLENRISSAMLASLRNIEANIGGLTSLIVRGDVGGQLAAGVKTGKTSDSLGNINRALRDMTGGLYDFFGIAAGISDFVFSGKVKVTGQGLTAAAKSIKDILETGFGLAEFVAINIKKKAFGVTVSNKNKIRTTAADETLNRQFGLIFEGFADAITQAAGPLGMAGKDFTDRLNNFVVDIGMIDLKGLSGEQIQEKLTAVFSSAADKIAVASLPGLELFQKVGEGYFETVVRVASGIEQATNATKRLGVAVIDYNQITNKQGDVGVELLRQSLVQSEQTGTINVARSASVNVAGLRTADARAAVDQFKQQLAASGAVAISGGALELQNRMEVIGRDFTRNWRGKKKWYDIFGEVQRAATDTLVYFETIEPVYSGIGRLIQAANVGSVSELEEFANTLYELRDAVIATGNGFRDVTEDLISGAGTFDRLRAGLESYFDDYLTKEEQAAELLRRTTNEFARIGLALPNGIDGFRALVKGIDEGTASGQALLGAVLALAPEFKTLADIQQQIMDEQARAAEQLANEQARAAEEAARATSSLVKSLRDLAEEANKQAAATAPVQNLADVRRQFQSVATRAALGDQAAAQSLPDIGRTLLSASRDYAASSQAYLADLALVSSAANRAADVQERGLGFMPAAPVPLPQNQATMAQSEQSAEIRAMRDDLNNAMYQIAKYTQRTADQLERWDDGDRMNVRIDNEANDPALVRTVA